MYGVNVQLGGFDSFRKADAIVVNIKGDQMIKINMRYMYVPLVKLAFRRLIIE